MTVPKPVRGPLFEQAAKLPVEGARRRKLFCLLAAYLDAGERSPPVKELAERIGEAPERIDILLRKLVKAGLIEVYWRPARTNYRNAYYLVALGDTRSSRARKQARHRHNRRKRERTQNACR